MMHLKLGIKSNVDCDEIKFEIVVDEHAIFSGVATESEQTIDVSLPELPADHCVEIKMSGKQSYHTKFDESWNIIDDISLEVSTLEIQDIDMKPIFCQGRQCYYHSFNDPEKPVFEDEFYGTMGCNGSVKIKFFTPIYLWMLDYF